MNTFGYFWCQKYQEGGLLNDGFTAALNFLGFGGDGTVPEGVYLNFMVFNSNFAFVNGGFSELGSSTSYVKLALMGDPFPEDGYLIAYVSFEKSNNHRAHFDDFLVTHKRSTVVQEEDYYPFGLTFNSYTSGNENLYKYNGMQEQKETGWYQPSEFRMYDPALGRFLMIDPVIKFHESPYAWNTNNPISFDDPSGADSTQRAQAISNSKIIVESNPEKSKYCYDPKGEKNAGAKGTAPGEAMDCSGMAANWREAGNEEVTVGSKETVEKAEDEFKKTNGVAQLAATSMEVDKDDVVAGNEIYFNGYSHIGLVTEVVKDKEGKNVVGYNVNHSSRSFGPHPSFIPVGGTKDYKIDSFRKWDTKPDKK